jgi:hypothetical protein
MYNQINISVSNVDQHSAITVKTKTNLNNSKSLSKKTSLFTGSAIDKHHDISSEIDSSSR